MTRVHVSTYFTFVCDLALTLFASSVHLAFGNFVFGERFLSCEGPVIGKALPEFVRQQGWIWIVVIVAMERVSRLRLRICAVDPSRLPWLRQRCRLVARLSTTSSLSLAASDTPSVLPRQPVDRSIPCGPRRWHHHTPLPPPSNRRRWVQPASSHHPNHPPILLLTIRLVQIECKQETQNKKPLKIVCRPTKPIEGLSKYPALPW